jgi:hypothetical protein
MKNNIRMFKMIAGIISVLLIGIPITMHAMSARPPEVSEQIEADGYLQKSYIDNRKTFMPETVSLACSKSSSRRSVRSAIKYSTSFFFHI